MKKTVKIFSFLFAIFLAYAAGVQSERALAESQARKGRATGIGGIFFKSPDPKKLREWYGKNLGLNMDDSGTNFEWRKSSNAKEKGFTQWGAFKDSTKYFEPSKSSLMINYRVTNLDGLLADLKKSGIEPVDKIDKVEYGKFVHIMDPDGNKVELWEPNDIEYEKLCKGKTTY